MNQIQEKIIEKFNSEFGDKADKPHRTKFIIDYYASIFKNIEGKIKPDYENCPAIAKSALRQSYQIMNSIEFEISKIDLFDEKLVSQIRIYEKILREITLHLDKIKKLDQFAKYLQIIQDIQQLNNALSMAVKGKNATKIMNLFLLLRGGSSSTHSISWRLQNIEAMYIRKYASTSSDYWYKVLNDKFSNDFETTLKNFKWPIQQQVNENGSSLKENLNKISTLAEYLLLIKNPEEDNTTTLINIGASLFCSPISSPIKSLLKPFQQRFLFHFTGSKQTNRLDKPEWYLTQILNWAKDNHNFIRENFQQAALKAGYENYNVRLEFIRGLVQMAIEKIAFDIIDITHNEIIFAHLVDEVLAFEIELRENLEYPDSYPSPLLVITQPQFLIKWISIEKNFCTSKMDIILQGDFSWIFIETSFFEDLRIPKCADQFVRLLESIKDRYSILPQPAHQLQFLNLQLELIDNFRIRLAQLCNNGLIEITNILNAIYYINAVLKEWGESIHYLHLHIALVGHNVDEIHSVFDRACQELQHWQETLIKALADKFVDEIKAKSMHYRHVNWSFLSEQNAKEPMTLSTTASDMFYVIMSNLHNFEKKLSLQLFNSVVHLSSQQLDEFFFDSIVMNTKFSVGGAAQFQFDMTRNLFTLFGHYHKKPEFLFKRIHDSCLLLTTTIGNTLLFYQTLKQDTTKDHTLKTLEEFGLIYLNPETCVDIVERRRDIIM